MGIADLVRIRVHRWLCYGIMVLVSVSALPGCSKIKEAVSDVKEKVSSTKTDLTTPAFTAGIEIEAGGPVKSSEAYASLDVLGEGRPSILQLRSYPDPTRERFPAVYFRATVQQTSLAALAGQRVTGQLFVQHQQDGTVYFTPEGSSVEITISAASDANLIAEITGKLANTADANSVDVRGKLLCTVNTTP